MSSGMYICECYYTMRCRGCVDHLATASTCAQVPANVNHTSTDTFKHYALSPPAKCCRSLQARRRAGNYLARGKFAHAHVSAKYVYALLANSKIEHESDCNADAFQMRFTTHPCPDLLWLLTHLSAMRRPACEHELRRCRSQKGMHTPWMHQATM